MNRPARIRYSRYTIAAGVLLTGYDVFPRKCPQSMYIIFIAVIMRLSTVTSHKYEKHDGSLCVQDSGLSWPVVGIHPLRPRRTVETKSFTVKWRGGGGCQDFRRGGAYRRRTKIVAGQVCTSQKWAMKWNWVLDGTGKRLGERIFRGKALPTPLAPPLWRDVSNNLKIGPHNFRFCFGNNSTQNRYFFLKF